MKTSVIGLGRLGLPWTVCLASKGFEVIGVDIDENKTTQIMKGISPIHETDLQKYLSKYIDFITCTNDINFAVKNSDISFILVNTPSRKDGSYSIEQLEPVCTQIGEALKDKKSFHVVVIRSTVNPTTCDTIIKPLLENHSNKKCGLDFGLCFSPEFIALGSVIHDFLEPDFNVIGESDDRSGTIVEDIYKIISNKKMVRTSIINAELVKILLNCYLTMKISFANTIGEICDAIIEADPYFVSETIGLDHRISGKFLKPGLGYGGPCFPRDNKALAYVTKNLDCQNFLSDASDRVNEIQVDRVVKKVQKICSTGTVALLGLSYKPNTSIVEASQSLEIAKNLVHRGYTVKVYDPQALKQARKILQEDVIYTTSAEDCLLNSDVAILTTPWKEFESLKISIPLIDCWGVINRKSFTSHIPG
jgi:UDPglucose 6-dehydrogenase